MSLYREHGEMDLISQEAGQRLRVVALWLLCVWVKDARNVVCKSSVRQMLVSGGRLYLSLGGAEVKQKVVLSCAARSEPHVRTRGSHSFEHSLRVPPDIARSMSEQSRRAKTVRTQTDRDQTRTHKTHRHQHRHTGCL